MEVRYLEPPAAAKNYSPVETTAVTAGGPIVLRDVIGCAVLIGAGAHAAKRFGLSGPAPRFLRRPPLEAASCFARSPARAPFFLAMTPGISIPCGLRLACESPRLAHREDCPAWSRSGGGCAMMSLPFLLFACGLGATWLRQRGRRWAFGSQVWWCCWCCSACI